MFNKLLIFFLVIASPCLSEENRLLDDRAEIEAYLASFPQDLYKIYNVPGQGRFFLDDIDDGIKNILKTGQIWEPHLVRLIYQYAEPGSVVIDIGAHIGTLTMTLANRVGPKGYVHAFEPQKKIFRELVANAVLNNFESRIGLNRYAIGDTHCIITMNPSTYRNEAGTGIGSGGDLAEMRTLDSFNFKNVSLIKIDVEGSEDGVIDGMVNTLRENRPVLIIEIQGGHFFDTAPQYIRDRILHTIQKLNDLGYSVSNIFAHDYLALPIN